MLFHCTGVSFLQVFFSGYWALAAVQEKLMPLKRDTLGVSHQLTSVAPRCLDDFCFCEVPSEAPPFPAFLYPGCSPD